MPEPTVLADGISPSLSTIYVCVALAILLCCIIGNLIVVITIYSGSEPKSPIDFYILNLAVSDIVSSLFGTISVDNVNMQWNVGVGFCKASYTLVYCCYAVAILTLCAMGIERYYGICRPAKGSKVSLFRNCYVTIPIIWTSSIALFVVYFYAYGLKKVKIAGGTKTMVCDEIWENKSQKFFLLFVPFILLLVTPVFIIGTTYVKVGQKFGAPRTPRSSGGNAVLYKKRKRTMQMLMTMVLVHYICWAPTIILKVLNSFGPQLQWYWPTWAILELLHYTRPLMYPFIYYMMYPHFKRNLRAIFKSCVPCMGTGTDGAAREGHSGSSLGSNGSRVFQYPDAEEGNDFSTEM